MIKRICTAALGISAALFTALTISVFGSVKPCVWAMIAADINFIAAAIINLGFRLAAENGYGDTAKLDRISRNTAVGLLIMSIPLFFVLLFHERITETAFAVYVNLTGVVLLSIILVADRKK